MSSQKAFCALCPQAAGQQQGQEQQQGQQGQEQQECVAPAPLGGLWAANRFLVLTFAEII